MRVASADHGPNHANTNVAIDVPDPVEGHVSSLNDANSSLPARVRTVCYVWGALDGLTYCRTSRIAMRT